ncbi:3-keto-steroid [Cyphellophora attinorum]|uniref:3-keto-steroid n=1 Tax=Cyphellophora attinorum TaxID=1664694 RepID=A0A0N1HFK5_9EURO|nr:3-keto-steroid [Phialophora attinorum]KPI44033.1 3-keto-steroid [Phialophora attinorum]
MTTDSKTTVLVTGGNNGIGLAACQLFISQPNYHVIMASRSLYRGQIAVESIISSTHSSSRLSLVQLDITSDGSIAAAVESVASLRQDNKQQRLNVLVNNAGICPTEFTRSTLRDALETNATSPAMVTKTFAPLLLRPSLTNDKSPPRIIYVSSSLGSVQRRTDPNDFAYTADYKAYRVSEAALNMVAVCDAWEYGDKGVKVFAVCPGPCWRARVEDAGGCSQRSGDECTELLEIAEGRRDADAGKFVYGEEAGGTYAW